MRNTTYTLFSNVYHPRDNTHKKTKFIRDSTDIAMLSASKDSSIDIMKKKDCNKKVKDMINELVQQRRYKETDDYFLKSKLIQSFLY